MIANRIKSLREKMGISQIKLAEIVNLSQQAIAKWETNKSEPDIEMLFKLSKIFKVSVSYLTGETNDPTPPDKKNIAPEAYPGQAEDLKKIWELAKDLSVEQIKSAISYIDFLNSQSDE